MNFARTATEISRWKKWNKHLEDFIQSLNDQTSTLKSKINIQWEELEEKDHVIRILVDMRWKPNENYGTKSCSNHSWGKSADRSSNNNSDLNNNISRNKINDNLSNNQINNNINKNNTSNNNISDNYSINNYNISNNNNKINNNNNDNIGNIINNNNNNNIDNNIRNGKKW